LQKEKRKARISRSSIGPVWQWLTQQLLPEAAAEYRAQVRKAALAGEPGAAEAAAARFRAAAAVRLKLALADPNSRKELLRLAEGTSVCDDADEMTILLEAADALCQAQDIIPKGSGPFTQEQLRSLRGLYDRVVQSSPDAAPYVSVVVMNRLERPWEALRLPLLVARHHDDALISSTDMGLVGEILLSKLDSHAVAIRSVRQPNFDPDPLIAHLARFALLSTGIPKEVDMRREGKWGKRLMGDRAAVADVMESMMQRAPREILAALPLLRTGAYAGGPKMPDLSRPPDAERVQRAIAYARLIRGCRTLAASAAFGAALLAADEEVGTALTRYCEDLLQELRAAEAQRLAHAENFLAVAANLVAILFTAEESELLRRRGRAATGVQAAA